jgi:hypothetical protein
MPRAAAIATLPFILSLSAVAQTPDLPSPLEPASRGMMQCYSPNTQEKTCQSMAIYRATANGGIENVANVLVLPSPAIVMTITSLATVRDAQVCGYVLTKDLDKASFTMGGTGVSPEMTANFRARMPILYGSTIEREVCTAYKPDGDAFVTSITVDGVPQHDAAMRVIWVSPSDGYRVGR